MMEGENEKMEFRASCCYLEIYNEEIRDLLRASGPDGPKQIRETADGVIQVCPRTCLLSGRWATGASCEQ